PWSHPTQSEGCLDQEEVDPAELRWVLAHNTLISRKHPLSVLYLLESVINRSPLHAPHLYVHDFAQRLQSLLELVFPSAVQALACVSINSQFFFLFLQQFANGFNPFGAIFKRGEVVYRLI